MCTLICRSLNLLVSVYKKNPLLAERIKSIRAKYSQTSKPLGPVGIAAAHMKKLGINWDGDLSMLSDSDQKPVKWLSMPVGEMKHDIREKARIWKWNEVIKKRSSLSGIDRGICSEKTNEYRLNASTPQGRTSASGYHSRRGEHSILHRKEDRRRHQLLRAE